MTLRSTIQDLRAHADAAKDQHRVKVRTGEFAEISARVSQRLTELPKLNTGLAEVMQLDLEMPAGREQEAEQVIEGLRALAAELPRMTMEQSLDLAKASVRSTERYVDRLRAIVSDAWRAHVSQPPPPINHDLIDALARGGVDVEEIREELETARGRLLAITSRTIPDAGDVEKFRAVIEAIQHCGERLGGVVDADVAEGLVGSQRSSGMPLTWFTPERLSKLAALGIVDRFRVRLR